MPTHTVLSPFETLFVILTRPSQGFVLQLDGSTVQDMLSWLGQSFMLWKIQQLLVLCFPDHRNQDTFSIFFCTWKMSQIVRVIRAVFNHPLTHSSVRGDTWPRHAPPFPTMLWIALLSFCNFVTTVVNITIASYLCFLAWEKRLPLGI